MAEKGAFWYTAYDLPDLAASRVCICKAPHDEEEEPDFHFAGETLFRFPWDQDSGKHEEVVVHNLQTGEVTEVTLSESLTDSDLEKARIVGETMIIPDSEGTLTNIRCVDLHTGEVRSVRVGLCERLDDMHVSADGQRIVVYRPRMDKEFLGDFAIYDL